MKLSLVLDIAIGVLIGGLALDGVHYAFFALNPPKLPVMATAGVERLPPLLIQPQAQRPVKKFTPETAEPTPTSQVQTDSPPPGCYGPPNARVCKASPQVEPRRATN